VREPYSGAAWEGKPKGRSRSVACRRKEHEEKGVGDQGLVEERYGCIMHWLKL